MDMDPVEVPAKITIPTGAAGATGLAVVLYDSLNVEGGIAGGVTAKKRNIIELRNLHAIVEQKTANFIPYLPSLDIYSLWWLFQHVKECMKAYNND